MAPNPDTIRPDILSRLLLVEAVAPVAPVPDHARKPPDFFEGRRFKGRVDTQLPNGDFKVLVAGKALQMNLPETARSGDRLELVLVTREPRLKFALLGDIRSSAGESTALSATGRFVGALVQGASGTSAAPMLAGAAPVLAAPPADSRQLPGQLQQALSQSGLFYESHQAQWVAGERPLEQLLHEPQARLSTAGPSQLNATVIEPVSRKSAEPEAIPAGATRHSNALVHEQILTLVQQQLSVLESGRLFWRGEIWPGQWMEWDVTEHPTAESETAEVPRWQTRLRLDLPQLGEVAAMLALDSSGVKIALVAAAAETEELFRSARQPLAAAMAEAGASVLAIEVRRDDGK